MKLEGTETGALRIAADARLVSDCFASSDVFAAIAVLKRKAADLATVLDKTALLAKNLDVLTPIYRE